jgi:alkyl hydroperoxide reductase subunit AhpF
MAFKMKGSPYKNKGAARKGAQTGLKGYKKGGSIKEFAKAVIKDPLSVPRLFGKSLKHTWKKHGPVINPSTKNPKGIGK